MLEVTQVAVCSQINTKHINTVWTELTVVEMLSLLVHHVTVGFKRLNQAVDMLFQRQSIAGSNPADGKDFLLR
jgi:hypothetical protein